jgi:uncharacterized membrane protein
MLLSIHIAAGALAIILGAIALVVRKGGTLHRRSGLLFVSTMLAMGLTASILEFRKGASATNVVAALITAYFVITALTTVRPASRWTRAIDIVALTVAVGLVIQEIAGGVRIFNLPGRTYNGVPFFMPFFLAAILTLAVMGDVRILRLGPPRGGPRLARHLWRMCFALFIAAGSFFSIRARVARVLPEPFTTGPMRALPILLLFGAMFYWLWRVRRREPVVIQRNLRPSFSD